MDKSFEDIYGYIHNTSSEISRGGQGVVYRTENPNIAVKVALDPNGNISKNISDNKIYESLRLLPIPEKINLTLPRATLRKYAGYVMNLLDDMESFESVFDYSFQAKCGYTNSWLESLGNEDISEVFAQYIVSGGRRRRLKAYMYTANILAKLHSSGLVYCDFSTKNAFISGSKDFDNVWLIDADNLDYQENTMKSGYYTPGFGAPEVLCGKGCTFYSDCYAFAVSLYWQLTGTHPFKGKLLEEKDFDDDDFDDNGEEKAYSGEFPWINDEDDTSNYKNTAIPYEYVVSKRLNDLFQRTFSEEGKNKRHTRPTMYEWVYFLSREADHNVRCEKCQMDYDSSFDICPWCDNKNKIIELSSVEGDDKVWSFSHEAAKGESFSVPLRIVNGFCSAQIDNVAFKAVKKADRIVISELNSQGEWFISSDNGRFTQIYGEVTLPQNCRLKHICGSREIMIEVNTK